MFCHLACRCIYVLAPLLFPFPLSPKAGNQSYVWKQGVVLSGCVKTWICLFMKTRAEEQTSPGGQTICKSGGKRQICRTAGRKASPAFLKLLCEDLLSADMASLSPQGLLWQPSHQRGVKSISSRLSCPAFISVWGTLTVCEEDLSWEMKHDNRMFVFKFLTWPARIGATASAGLG